MFNSIRQAIEDYRTEMETRRELSELSNDELRDIGLYRCDIPRVAREHVAMQRETHDD